MAGKVKIALGFLATLLVLIPGIALAAVVPVQVTFDAGNQGRPDVSGDYLIWKGNQAGNWNIYMKDLSTGTYLDVTLNTATQNLPVTNGSVVVWQDNRNGTEDIYWRAMPGGSEQVLISGPGNQGLSDISGNTVVYVDNSSGNNDVYAKDINTGILTPVCTNPASQWQPRISGDMVVWEDNRSGNWNIYTKTLDGAGDGTPVYAESNDQKVSDIYDGKVVWQVHNSTSGYYDIWTKDLDSADPAEPVTDDAAYQNSPRISGDLVVWEDYRNGNYDIYMKDLTSEVESPLATGAGVQARPSVYGETVTWESDPATGNYDIWMATVADEWPPVISGLTPAADSSLGCTGPTTISASYTDNRVGIDTGSVQLLLDGDDVTADATVSESGIVYNPANSLTDDTHTASLSVSDFSGNTASSSWDFSTSSPLLSLNITNPFWASWDDYLSHWLSTGYTMNNLSADAAARSVSILASPASNGVIYMDTTPLAGDIEPGQQRAYVARYLVPPTVLSFKTYVFAGCEDDCGWTVYFPAPPPGP